MSGKKEIDFSSKEPVFSNKASDFTLFSNNKTDVNYYLNLLKDKYANIFDGLYNEYKLSSKEDKRNNCYLLSCELRADDKTCKEIIEELKKDKKAYSNFISGVFSHRCKDTVDEMLEAEKDLISSANVIDALDNAKDKHKANFKKLFDYYHAALTVPFQKLDFYNDRIKANKRDVCQAFIDELDKKGVPISFKFIVENIKNDPRFKYKYDDFLSGWVSHRCKDAVEALLAEDKMIFEQNTKSYQLNNF